MQITVKSSRCLSKGTNDYGPWALYKFISTDDKIYTTLAEGAEVIKVGAVFEPDAITVDEKHEGQFQFKKFTLISTPGSAPQPQPASALPYPQPDPTPYAGITAGLMYLGGAIPQDDPLIAQILNWCRQSLPEAPEVAEELSTSDQDWDKMTRDADPATGKQLVQIGEEARKAGYQPDELREYVDKTFGKTDSKALSGAEADELLTAIKEKKIGKVGNAET